MPTVRINRLRFMRGCSAGLDERTALADLEIIDAPGDLTPCLARLREGLRRLRPPEFIWGDTGGHDDPEVFLRDAPASPRYALARWIVAATIALQRLAGDAAWRGRVLDDTTAGESSLCLALPCQREPVLREALVLATRQVLLDCNPGADPAPADELAQAMQRWLDQARAGGLSPSSLRFLIAARQRGIPVDVRAQGVLRLGWGSHAELLDSSFSGRTGNIAARTARNKFAASQLLRTAALPVPPSGVARNLDQAARMADRLGWPVVVKPIGTEQGTAVFPGVTDHGQLAAAFAIAERHSPGAVLIEKHVEGQDHRLLVVNGELLIATRRIPGGVTGDGRSTVAQLLRSVNDDPRRGSGRHNVLVALAIDDEARECLRRQGLTADDIPEAERVVYLRRTANISTGGTAVDVTEQVHPDNRAAAIRAARLIGLDIAGVDFLSPDIARSWRQAGGAICEVNAQPGFRPHWLASPRRDINGEILDRLFAGRPARIPTAAISGTNGKGTVARMLHHIWIGAGKRAGVCTTNGVWIGREMVNDQNLSGLPGARLLLDDPFVEAAVIEMPRKGLIHFGHACDRYDVAALINVQDDHIDRDGIDSLEQMAALKAEVLERADHAVVLNADDPLCMGMRDRAGGARRILVTQHADDPLVAAHLAAGGEAVLARQDSGVPVIVLARGGDMQPLMPVAGIPATMNGRLRFNTFNAMFAVALAWAQGIATSSIRESLRGFRNSPEHNPGRYNLIDGFPFKVMLDYAHNPVAVNELCAIVADIEVRGRRRLFSMEIGNRHRSHVRTVAPALARSFDDFVMTCDAVFARQCPDYAGDDPVGAMLATLREELGAAGVDAERLTVERDIGEALRIAIDSAGEGDLLVLLAEPWIALSALEAARSRGGTEAMRRSEMA